MENNQMKVTRSWYNDLNIAILEGSFWREDIDRWQLLPKNKICLVLFDKKNCIWAVKNAAGYYPGPVTQITVDGAPSCSLQQALAQR